MMSVVVRWHRVRYASRAVVPSTRSGFGTLLIERQPAYELDGTSELDFAPEGLGVKFHVP